MPCPVLTKGIWLGHVRYGRRVPASGQAMAGTERGERPCLSDTLRWERQAGQTAGRKRSAKPDKRSTDSEGKLWPGGGVCRNESRNDGVGTLDRRDFVGPLE
eukprot:2894240-Rhodomonas_salina.1